MRRIVMGLVILTALLAGVALLSAYALPLLTSAQHGQRMLQTEHDAPLGPVPPMQDDSHALVRVIFSMQGFSHAMPFRGQDLRHSLLSGCIDVAQNDSSLQPTDNPHQDLCRSCVLYK